MKSFENVSVAIVSPTINLFEPIRKGLEGGIEYLKDLGFNVIVAPHVSLDGAKLNEKDDKQIAKEIMEMYENKDIKYIFCAYGGISSQRLLPLLDFDIIKNNPKPLIGFSDSTAIQLGVYQMTGNAYISGFTPEYAFRKTDVIDSLIHDTLLKAFNGEKQRIMSGVTLNEGKSQGVLIGDCLSLISSLSGSKYYPDLAGKILMVEDEWESSYKVFQMLQQLSQAPNFDKLKGIIFGAFTDCTDSSSHESIDDTIISFAAAHSEIPMIKDFKFGHIPSRYVLPMGVEYELDATTCTLKQI